MLWEADLHNRSVTYSIKLCEKNNSDHILVLISLPADLI